VSTDGWELTQLLYQAISVPDPVNIVTKDLKLMLCPSTLVWHADPVMIKECSQTILMLELDLLLRLLYCCVDPLKIWVLDSRGSSKWWQDLEQLGTALYMQIHGRDLHVHLHQPEEQVICYLVSACSPLTTAVVCSLLTQWKLSCLNGDANFPLSWMERQIGPPQTLSLWRYWIWCYQELGQLPHHTIGSLETSHQWHLSMRRGTHLMGSKILRDTLYMGGGGGGHDPDWIQQISDIQDTS
jgi:hypothetical protein